VQPNIHWTKEGVRIQSGETFKIDKLDIKDANTYTCIAENDSGKPAKKTFNIAVTDPPSIIYSPKNLTVNSNQPITAECFATGHPDPDVYWVHDGERIQDGISFVMNSSMASGFYSCVAENSERIVENKFFFKTVSKPNLIKEFDPTKHQKDVQEGEKLELLCPFENYANISWEANGVVLQEQTKILLEIQNIKTSSKGEIKCIATNSAGSSTFLFEVNILAKPKIVAINKKTLGTIFKTVDNEKILIKSGNNLELQCEATGNPVPMMSWKKDENVIAEGKILKFVKISNMDVGTYSCEAKNNIGIAKNFFEIDVSSPPVIQDGVKLVELTKNAGESVTLKCNIDGSPSPDYSWLKDG
jgi:hemicentin